MKTELEAERDRRRKLFDSVMEEQNLDALVFTSTAQQGNQMAVKYATNYPLITRRDFSFVKKGGMPFLVVPTVGQQYNAGQISWLPEENVLCGDMVKIVTDFIRSIPSKRPRIGLYESQDIPVSIYHALESTAAEFVDITELLTERRAPKSEYELKMTEIASEIAVDSFRWVVRNLHPGCTEQEIIGGAEGFLRAHGAEDTLVLTRSIKPHTFITRARDFKIKEDGMFVYSCEMAGPGGYWTQVVHPIFMSRGCEPEAYRVMQVIKEALAEGEEKLRPGFRICDVDEAIAKVVKKHGCHAGVWSGHGMGADLGDGISIGAPNQMELKPNMILTLHPSVIGDGDGLLCGSTYRITENGFVNLTGEYGDLCYLEDLKNAVG